MKVRTVLACFNFDSSFIELYIVLITDHSSLQQKIILKVQLDCDKCRSKALKIAAEAKGVSSVSLEGDDRDKLVVTGEVDAVCLARVLRKKFRCVTLQSVEDVTKKDEKQDKKAKDIICVPCPPQPCVPCPPQPCAPYPYSYCYVVQDPYPTGCFVM
ncbi:hypothetical protein L6164_005368 [Bauhinia variegata]|uniref:Uncharacterized protein n=1 Tax=Bauhinia variegata TaxID=167791 RepID=A0ACB9PR19_BAUVA|nr:hypothetical protein L6164_005368 [Bauhinia variegata]